MSRPRRGVALFSALAFGALAWAQSALAAPGDLDPDFGNNGSLALTPGGHAAYYMTAPDGERHSGWWRIKEVDPMSRLLIEDGFGEVGEQNDEMPGPGQMIVTFEESDGRTTMTIESRRPAARNASR